jgi:hypothetical protein
LAIRGKGEGREGWWCREPGVKDRRSPPGQAETGLWGVWNMGPRETGDVPSMARQAAAVGTFLGRHK